MDTKFLRPKGLIALDLEIERLVEHLSHIQTTHEDYLTVANRLKILCEAREKRNDRVISSEALLAAAVNLIGIVVILNFERTGIITSKALSFLKLGK